MRIVHDIETKVQCTGGDMRPYVVPTDERPSLPIGFRVTLTGAAVCPFGGEDEVIHIHGDAYHIREMLDEMMSIIDMLAEYGIKDKLIDPDWLKLSGDRQSKLDEEELEKRIISEADKAKGPLLK